MGVRVKQYIVQYGGPGVPMWTAITKGTTRANAHALAARLGYGYRVFNTWTRRESHADQA